MAEPRTWVWDSDLASWSYRPMARSDDRLIPLNLEAPEGRSRWLQRLLGRLPSVLGDFGYMTKVQCSASSRGDPACVVDWRSQRGPATLGAFLEQTADIFEVLVTVNLTCRGEDLEPREIEGGASLWITIHLNDSGALDVSRDHPVYLRVALNADIYAPQSHADVQNNALLASLNGPRLAGFLERIERDVPAQLYAINDDQYPGMLGPRGFKAPSGAASDA
jgi:hypothetical protein